MEHANLNDLTEQASNELYESVQDIESLNRRKTQMFTLINAMADSQLSALLPSYNTTTIKMDLSILSTGHRLVT